MQKITPLRNTAEMHKALTQALAPFKTADAVKAELENRNSMLYAMSRILRRYDRAYKAAGNFGWIGVGCITFAEARMVQFQERILRRYDM